MHGTSQKKNEKRMMITFLLLQLFHLGCTKYISLISQHSSTWEGANNFCNQCGGKLAVVDHQTEIAIKNITTTEKFWTGLHTSISGWMEIRGCFSLFDVRPELEEEREFSNLERNSIGTASRKMASSCQMYCKNYNSFALNMNRCLCLKNPPAHRLIQDINNCQWNCTSSVKGLCGGEMHATVYKHVSGIDETLNGNCMAVYCNGVWTTSLVPKPCSFKDNVYPVCAYGALDSSNDDVIYIDGELSWTQSSEECKTSYSRYLVWNIQSLCMSIAIPDEETYYWTGVFRHRGFQWTKEANSRNLKCVSLTKEGKVFDTPCSLGKPFICEFENMNHNCYGAESIQVPSPVTISITTSGTETSVATFSTNDYQNTFISDTNGLSTTLFNGNTSDGNSTNQYDKSTANINMSTEDYPGISTVGFSQRRNNAPETTPQGVIIGAVISVLVVMVLVLIGIVVFCKRRNKEERCQKKAESKKKINESKQFVNASYTIDSGETRLAVSAAADFYDVELINNPKIDNNGNKSTDYVNLNQVKRNSNFTDANVNSVYYESNENDYDHLGIQRSRKLSNTNDNALYDHTLTNDDPFNMYDTTNTAVAHNTRNDYETTNRQDYVYDTC